MIVLSRFQRGDPGRSVPAGQPAGAPDDDFDSALRATLTAFAGRPGFLRGRVARAADDPTVWILLTEWESVGSFRRALGAYEVKISATPLLAQALDEPAAFEVLLDADPSGATERPTALAQEPDEPTDQIRASRS